ncbi:hypothetical protein [Candidatus Vampirococcus lugosii]|uniref:Uncharacterized protein n=1 Tax=Candidatus Vampirococcus lugosii TaxID=2789015 RepID=A0ABS5QKK6_9BACT|nr:hypothetical protein [Candidatus Vampirococcus lugosii]MBS8121554.1 hypothetical protein [Candidatus Vampirococcus lugosii]
MLFYHIGSLIKIIIGFAILYIIYNYINVYQDPIIGLGFGFFGLFLISWGISFYIFFIGYKIFSKKDNILISSKSYKTSLLFGFYIIINTSLIIMENRTQTIGIVTIVIFLFLHILTILENE